jgi:hypothetical protein
VLGINPISDPAEGYYLDAVAQGVDEYYRGVGEAPDGGPAPPPRSS